MKTRFLTSSLLAALLATGCSSNDSTPAASGTHDLAKMRLVLTTNADIAYAKYSDAVATAENLETAFDAMAAADDDSVALATALENTKKAWLAAREAYGSTEVYRDGASPIDDDPEVVGDGDGPEGAINAWPLGEALIDYVVTGNDFGNAELDTEHTVNAGNEVPSPINPDQDGADPYNVVADNIIHDTDVTLDDDLLAKSEAGDGRDIISGYHAIEFMLWGQDLNTSGTGGANSNGTRDQLSPYAGLADPALGSAGHRPVSDFLNTAACTSGSVDQTDGSFCARRIAYMQLVAQKLVADLTAVRNQWDPAGTDNYYDTFTTVSTVAEAKERFLTLLTAMADLAGGEFATERMNVALSADAQEDEHSCFSDNTHRDIWLNARGIADSYYGEYAGYNEQPWIDTTSQINDDNAVTALNDDAYGFDDYLDDIGLDDLAGDIEDALDATESGYISIDTLARGGTPFDVMINDTDHEEVTTTIDALTVEANGLSDIIDAMNLD